MKSENLKAELVLDARARLGECPLWDEAQQVLYWIDIYGHRVHQYSPATGATHYVDLEDIPGPMSLAGSHRMLMAQRHQLVWLDPKTGDLETICTIEGDRPQNRFNDGKCDRKGRFWVGSMSEAEQPEACLYRYDADGSVHVMEKGLTISNGLGWSPDNTTFYLTDSPAQKIYAYDFDVESGNIAARRVHVDLTHESFSPDGLTIDCEGCIWSAMWDGWAVIRFDPEGQEIMRVPVPVQRPTSCTFGGADLRELYITTASVGLSQQEIQKSFFAGGVFRLATEVAGLPGYAFGHRA